MLSNLSIQNVALIDSLSIDFSPSLNVLSGETGAGKSIIIDSLNFVLGSKPVKTLIKQGCDYMKVTACFLPPFSNEVKKVLLSYDFDAEEDIIISRIYYVDGKSSIKVNGQTFNSTMLKSLSSLLVDIHGQHEHQRLLSPSSHLSIVDSFIKDKTIFNDYSAKFGELKEINCKIEKLHGSSSNQERMLDLLSYQINEIENAEIKQNEDSDLQDKMIIMQNAEKIYDNLYNAYNSIENSSLFENIKVAISNLSNITKYDSSLSELVDRIESCKYDLMDISSVLKDKASSVSFDKYEFETIDARLDLIKTIKKKYGPTLDDVFAFLENAKREYDEIVNSKSLLQKLLKTKKDILIKLYAIAGDLRSMRLKVAENLQSRVTKELADLGMKSAQFKILFNDFPEIDDGIEKNILSNGFDKVFFMFSANAGQDLRPLSEIISGGEASRFMLAIKNIIAENDDISLMVFDEIDSGISGEMGYKVACKLANISQTHQVMSVSHLPQICAMADNNIFVEKSVDAGKTIVSVKTLGEKEVLGEIARLSGGENNNEISINHAKELKNRCSKYKATLIG